MDFLLDFSLVVYHAKLIHKLVEVEVERKTNPGLRYFVVLMTFYPHDMIVVVRSISPVNIIRKLKI